MKGRREHAGAQDKPSSLDWAMARGMVLIAGFAAIAGAARVIQDAAIAWRFGTEPVVDAYYFVVGLCNWPVAVAMSSLTLLVAPTEAALKVGGAGLVRRFQGELLAALLASATLAIPLSWWVLNAIIVSGWSGLDDRATAVASAGVPGLLAVIPLGMVGALMAARLVAGGRHVLTLLEALPALVLASALLVVPGPVLFWGTAAGVSVQVLVMAWVLKISDGLPSPRWPVETAAWRGFLHGITALMTAQMLFALIPLVDPFFAARLGEGKLATLSYANRLVLGLQGLAGLAVQRAGLPLLSRLMSVSPTHAYRAALRWALAAAAAGVVLGIVVAVLAEPLVALLFERGRFTSANREQVASLLRCGMLQMPPFLAGTAMVTALAAARGGAHLLLAAGLGLAVKLILSWILVVTHGVAGLLLATAIMYVATGCAVGYALHRHLDKCQV